MKKQILSVSILALIGAASIGMTSQVLASESKSDAMPPVGIYVGYGDGACVTVKVEKDKGFVSGMSDKEFDLVRKNPNKANQILKGQFTKDNQGTLTPVKDNLFKIITPTSPGQPNCVVSAQINKNKSITLINENGCIPFHGNSFGFIYPDDSSNPNAELKLVESK